MQTNTFYISLMPQQAVLIINNFYGKAKAHVHTVGESESGVISFDWDAAKSFSNSVSQALGPYMIP